MPMPLAKRTETPAAAVPLGAWAGPHPLGKVLTVGDGRADCASIILTQDEADALAEQLKRRTER